jgi:PAS domain S-box-containing protein
VTALAQTPDGYLWVGTSDGLLRFNGVHFSRASEFSELQRLRGVISFLETDRSGRLWVCGEGRLACYDAGTWRRFEGTNLNVRSIAQSTNGQMWIGGGEGQLYTIVNDAVKSVPPVAELTKSNGVFCISDTRDGQCWLANRGYIGRLTAAGWRRVDAPGPPPSGLLAAPAQTGGLWIYTAGQLRRYQTDGANDSVTRYPAPVLGWAREMIEDRSGTIWIATIRNGLYHFRPGGEVFNINVTNGLYHNAIRCLIEDREGNVWAGGSLNGLSRFKPQQFFSIGRAEGLPNNSVQAIVETAPGEIVVGTHGGGLAHIREGRVTVEPPATNGAGQFVWSLLQDRKGRLWIGTFNDGLFVVEAGVRRAFPIPAVLGTTVNQLMEDAQGRIWVGGSAGLGIIADDAMTTCFTNSILAGQAITALATDAKSGNIWIGTHTDGVFQMDGANFSHVTALPGCSGRRITSLTLDDQGYLWIGLFEQGLACFHEGQTTFIGPPQGLLPDTVGSIVDDNHGWFWLGTSQGILRVARSELQRVARTSSPPANFNLFNVSDGLGSDSCVEGYQPTALRSRAGPLWFSTDRGVVTVDPTHLRLNTNPPPVVIELASFTDRAGTNHVLRYPHDPLLVSAGSSELEFDFDALSLTAPEKVVFRYRLEGANNNWIVLGNRRELHFREPARGHYVLHMTAANNDGVWNETGTSLAFTVQPFLWQTLWFRLLALVGLAAGGGALVWRITRRSYQRRIEQLQRERGFEQERARERQRAEVELQRREEYFRSLIEHASDSITVIDLRGIITYQSSSGERILGYPPATILGRNLFDLVHPEDVPRSRAILAQAASQLGEPVKVIARLRHRNGAWRTVETVGTCVQTPAGEKQGILNARDITDNLQLEEQLRQAQKMEAVGQLAGGVAHDFNNILSSLLMQTELVGMTGPLPAEAREGLTQIAADTRRAADLTRQLLLFSRRQVMQLRLLDLNEVVLNLARMLQRIIREDVRLQLHLHPTPLWTCADTGMLEQVLMNLAVNARDAMPQGGQLLIETADAAVDAQAARLNPDAAPGRYVCLRVTDTGDGIAPEVLPRIFEPFFTTKEPGKGTGLGLATVFGIVKQHQGWLQLDNRPGQGVTFQVYLPASGAPGAEPLAAEPKPKPRGGTETILLVEDEVAVRKPTRQMLERHGYTVLEAEEGEAALKLWEAHRGEVAMLFTDLVMPGGLAGRELGRRLKAERPDLKVIFASGYSAEIAGRDFQLQPGEAFLQKPCTMEHLLDTIRQCLDNSRQE